MIKGAMNTSGMTRPKMRRLALSAGGDDQRAALDMRSRRIPPDQALIPLSALL